MTATLPPLGSTNSPFENIEAALLHAFCLFVGAVSLAFFIWLVVIYPTFSVGTLFTILIDLVFGTVFMLLFAWAAYQGEIQRAIESLMGRPLMQGLSSTPASSPEKGADRVMRRNKKSGDIRKEFQQAGFEVVGTSAVSDAFEVKKSNCRWTIRRDAGGRWETFGAPLFNVRGEWGELEDRGYQKFWLHQGRRFPIHLGDLREFHGFIEEVRTIVGAFILYNESLGSTCARTVYDRLEGRPDR